MKFTILLKVVNSHVLNQLHIYRTALAHPHPFCSTIEANLSIVRLSIFNFSLVGIQRSTRENAALSIMNNHPLVAS